jgi:hypothetical protein
MRHSQAHESAWASAHVFYQEDLDRLLVHVVAPLIDELRTAGLAEEFFYLRYWDGGPHLRLRILPGTGTDRSTVEWLVAERFRAYLAENPSPDRLSPARYARQARTLARLEGMTSYTEHCLSNNSVLFVPYRREHHRYGHGPAIQAVERHFVESSRIALRAVVMGASTTQRTAAAVAVVLLAWFVAPAPLVGSADRLQESPQVLRLAEQMRGLAARAGTLAPGGMLVDWARSLVVLRDSLLARAGTGDSTVAAVLDTCAHLICNRLGLSIAAEGAVRALGSNAMHALTTRDGGYLLSRTKRLRS